MKEMSSWCAANLVCTATGWQPNCI